MSIGKFSNKSATCRRPLWWSIVPVLLRPRIATLVRFSPQAELPGNWLKNGLLTIFIAILLFGIAESTTVALEGISANLPAGVLSPLIPSQVVFLSFLILLSLSGLVGSLGGLLLSHELDLLRGAPLRSGTFFFGKLFEISILATWFPALLVCPILLAIGLFFDASILFYLCFVTTLVLLALMGVACAMALVTVIARVISAKQTKTFFVATGLLGILGGYFFLHYRIPPEMMTKDLGDVVRDLVARGDIAALIPQGFFASLVMSPATLSARALEAAWRGEPIAMWGNLGLLATMSGLMVVGAWCVVAWLHGDALAKIVNARPGRSMLRRNTPRKVIWPLSIIPSSTRALLVKEMRLFSRDMIQALQLLVLLGLSVVYLYNFQILRSAGDFANLTDGARLWWEAVLVLLNLSLGSLVTATVCMRFVFPSISLEGQAMWILQKSPLSARELLQGKFWCWLVPLGAIMSVVMVSGAMAVQAEPQIILVSAVVSWILCYGIVGLAVGLGAVFANFSWEHPAQVTASLGAAVFLAASSVLVFIAMIPTAALIALRTVRTQGFEFSPLQWAALVTIASFLVVYVNVLTNRWAMKLGAQALRNSR